MTKSLLTKICLLAGLALAGCKAGEVPDSAFNPNPELMSKSDTVPFQRTYWNNKVNPKSYREIFIAPVNTDYLMAQGSWEQMNIANLDKEKLKKEIGELAEYTQKSFIKAFRDDPNNRFTVVDTPGPDTLIVELALVQVVPSRTVLSTVGCVFPSAAAAVGMTGGAASKSQDVGKGVVAIEGRARDGRTGKIIGMFADCEHPKSAIIDLKAINWWAPAKVIIDEWAKQMVDVANKPPGAVVKDSSAFELLIW